MGERRKKGKKKGWQGKLKIDNLIYYEGKEGKRETHNFSSS